MDVKVSILVPVYKAEKYIEECLCSLFGQTYDNIEYVFVNDATPDESMNIVMRTISKYPNRSNSVTIIDNKTNLGVADTRNILLDKATGDYIYFVDSDDFIALDTIASLVDIAQEKKADIVRCNFNNYIDNKSIPNIRKPLEKDTDYLRDCLANETGMNALWLLLIRRALIIDHDLSFSKGINGCEDFLMTIKLLYFANVIVDTPLALYYYRSDNIVSITHNEAIFRNDYIKAVCEIKSFLTEKGIYDRYTNELQNLMFISKQKFLLNKAIRDIDKYINTFPESNNCYKSYNYSLKEKTLFFLANHRYKMILKLICKYL